MPKRRRAADNIDAMVGAKIRARRVELGRSQTDLANHLGLTFQQVQKYEKGMNRVSASMLWKVCDFLNVEPGWFFPPIKPSLHGKDATTDHLKFLGKREGLLLVEALEDMPPQVAAALCRLSALIAKAM